MPPARRAPSRTAKPRRAPRGRPKGRSSTDVLVDFHDYLAKHPNGVTFDAALKFLRATRPTLKKYLARLGDDVLIEPRAPTVDDRSRSIIKLLTRNTPHTITLTRYQIFGLLMARNLYASIRGTELFDALEQAFDQFLAFVARPRGVGAKSDLELLDARMPDRVMYLERTPMKSLVDRPEIAETFDAIFTASTMQRPCEIQYRHDPRGEGPGETKTYPIHPYAMVLYNGAYYCLGLKTGDGSFYPFRIDRLVDVDADSATRFGVPADFKVSSHFSGNFGIIAGKERIAVELEFLPRVKGLISLRDLPGNGPNGKAEEVDLPNGNMILKMVVGDLRELRSWILSFGETVRVREPRNLRKIVLEELRGAVRWNEELDVEEPSPAIKSPPRSPA